MQDKDIIELFWQRDEAAITATDRKYGKYCRRNAIPESRPYHFQGFLAKITRYIAIDRRERQGGKAPHEPCADPGRVPSRNRSHMEIMVIRYFLTVVREESITKAAEILHITQPTISR